RVAVDQDLGDRAAIEMAQQIREWHLRDLSLRAGAHQHAGCNDDGDGRGGDNRESSARPLACKHRDAPFSRKVRLKADTTLKHSRYVVSGFSRSRSLVLKGIFRGGRGKRADILHDRESNVNAARSAV